MSDEQDPQQPIAKERRALLLIGTIVTINGKQFKLEMRAVVSGTAEDIEAAELKKLT